MVALVADNHAFHTTPVQWNNAALFLQGHSRVSDAGHTIPHIHASHVRHNCSMVDDSYDILILIIMDLSYLTSCPFINLSVYHIFVELMKTTGCSMFIKYCVFS